MSLYFVAQGNVCPGDKESQVLDASLSQDHSTDDLRASLQIQAHRGRMCLHQTHKSVPLAPCWSGPGMNQSRWNIELGPHRFWDVCPGLCVCCFKLSQSKKASEKINKMLLILLPFHVWAHWGHLICKTVLFVEFNGCPWLMTATCVLVLFRQRCSILSPGEKTVGRQNLNKHPQRLRPVVLAVYKTKHYGSNITKMCSKSLV